MTVVKEKAANTPRGDQNHYIDTYINSSKFTLQSYQTQVIPGAGQDIQGRVSGEEKEKDRSQESCITSIDHMEFETESDNDGGHAVAAMFFVPGEPS